MPGDPYRSAPKRKLFGRIDLVVLIPTAALLFAAVLSIIADFWQLGVGCVVATILLLLFDSWVHRPRPGAQPGRRPAPARSRPRQTPDRRPGPPPQRRPDPTRYPPPERGGRPDRIDRMERSMPPGGERRREPNGYPRRTPMRGQPDPRQPQRPPQRRPRTDFGR